MSSTVATAAREYANRPADERYPTVHAMVGAAQHEREHSKEATYNLKDLRIGAIDNGTPLGTLHVESPKGVASFSHWAFGQFARMVGAPASYLREIPAAIAAQALNFGLKDSPTGSVANLLVKMPNGSPTPIVRAATTDSYARVWDSELYGLIQKTVVDRGGQMGQTWSTPPTWSGESAGVYRGDRDSFVVLVNGGSIVKDPSLTASDVANAGPDKGTGMGDGMYRGLLIRNSEVGAASLTIETILYRYICGNHMLWGAIVDKRFRRRHVGARIVRDAVREIASFAQAYVNQSSSRDEAIIKALITHELAATKEGVIDELRAVGFTKDAANAAYVLCEQKESLSPRSAWGIVQGATRLSQESAYQDERFTLDQLAAKILAKSVAKIGVRV